jgi:glutaminyl-tRNA synthetase
LKYGFVVRCTGYSKDERTGQVTEVHCDYLPETKSGTAGAEAVKVKGTIHWVSAAQAYEAEVRLYDRLFVEPQPGAGTHEYLDDVNSKARKVIRACLEPSLREAKPEERFQFERHGYFVADRRDSGVGAPVFNRTVTLRDSWGAGKT